METNKARKFDYRFLLMNELERRQGKNPSYSLRAFARTLDVSAAYLSQIFSGKRVLTAETAFLFSQKLKWNKKKKTLFLALLEYQKAPDEEAKELALSKIHDLSELDFVELEQDQFQLVSAWYHYAIVELRDLASFRNDPKWIAKRLGITSTEANDAIQRLIRIGLLVEVDGNLLKGSPFHRIQDVPSEAIRHFHKQHLEAARKALESQTFETRDFSSTTVAIPKKNIPEVKNLIRDFRNKLNRYCSEQEHPDAVYHLAMQFFRLDKEIK